MNDSLPEDNSDVLTEQKPLSLLNLLKDAPALCKEIRGLPVEFLEMTERELEKGWNPTSEMKRLKISFWQEYSRAQRNRDKMILKNILDGVCSPFHFYNKWMRDQRLLAWLVQPPADEMLVNRELLQIAQGRLREVLELPIMESKPFKKKNGEIITRKIVNVALVKEIRAIFEKLQDRVHGSIIQRQQIEAKTMSVHVGDKKPDGELSIAEVEKLLRKIEEQVPSAKALPETIEGEVSE